MKKILLILLLFSSAVSAQHTRRSLTHPDYDDYNLKAWPQEMTVVHRYSAGNDVNFQEVYLFDSTGHLSQYTKRGFGGRQSVAFPLAMTAEGGWNVLESIHYKFDYDGDIVESRQYDLKGRLAISAHYIYAEGGNLVQHIEYTYDPDSNVVSKRTVYSYDKHERLVKMEQYTADELLLCSEKRKYDRRGNLVKRTQVFYSDEGTSTTVEKRSYTFDKHGNWTQCRYALNGKHLYTIVRTIVYYGEKR